MQFDTSYVHSNLWQAETLGDIIRNHKLLLLVKLSHCTGDLILSQDDMGDEEVVEKAHDSDAVHAICPAAMTRQGVSEVLDTDRTLKT